MGFFSDFTLIKNKRGYVVRYGGDPLMQIYSKSFVQVFKDYASQKFINDMVPLSTNERKDDVSKDVASKLEKYYTIRKRDYYGNKKIKRIEHTSTDYAHFLKASQIVRNHEVSVKDFLDAQMAGLSFVNDGEGTFPKPAQLSSSGSEDRLVVYISDKTSDKKPKEEKRLELTRYDRENELKSNPKFMDRYEKVKNNKATLQDAYFVHDCMIVRKDYATPMVNKYIEKLEKGISCGGKK